MVSCRRSSAVARRSACPGSRGGGGSGARPAFAHVAPFSSLCSTLRLCKHAFPVSAVPRVERAAPVSETRSALPSRSRSPLCGPPRTLLRCSTTARSSHQAPAACLSTAQAARRLARPRRRLVLHRRATHLVRPRQQQEGPPAGHSARSASRACPSASRPRPLPPRRPRPPRPPSPPRPHQRRPRPPPLALASPHPAPPGPRSGSASTRLRAPPPPL